MVSDCSRTKSGTNVSPLEWVALIFFTPVLLSAAEPSAPLQMPARLLSHPLSQKLRDLHEQLTLLEAETREQTFLNSSSSPQLFETFRLSLFLTVAMDPTGPFATEVPEKYRSSFLTAELEKQWSQLEKATTSLNFSPQQTKQWETLKQHMSQFFLFRKQSLYQKARSLLKSGVLLEALDEMGSEFKKINNNQTPKAFPKVPVAQTGTRIGQIISGLDQLGEFLESNSLDQNQVLYPAAIESSSTQRELDASPVFFNKVRGFFENLPHLSSLGLMLFITSICAALSVFLRKIFRQKHPAASQNLSFQGSRARAGAGVCQTPSPLLLERPESFNYAGWLGDLQQAIEDYKLAESVLDHKHKVATELMNKLKESRQDLQVVSTKDFQTALGKVNSAMIAVEKYLQDPAYMVALRPQKRIIKLMLALCSAVEKKHTIQFQSEATH
jgi:hypothetical protein